MQVFSGMEDRQVTEVYLEEWCLLGCYAVKTSNLTRYILSICAYKHVGIIFNFASLMPIISISNRVFRLGLILRISKEKN
jgi:hypothetical protein